MMLAIAVLAGVGLAACQRQATRAGELQAKALFQSTQCGYTGRLPVAAWITTPFELHQLFQRLGRSEVGGSTNPPEVDFARNAVLLVEMGQQSTSGYGLELLQESVPVDHDTATVTLSWRRPLPGTITAQVLTSPCLLVGLPRDHYSAIQILDQASQPRLTLPLERHAR